MTRQKNKPPMKNFWLRHWSHRKFNGIVTNDCVVNQERGSISNPKSEEIVKHSIVFDNMGCRLLLASTLIATFFCQAAGKLTIMPSDTDVRKNHSTHFNCSTDIGSSAIFWFHGEYYIYTGFAILEPYTERFSVDQYVWNGTYNYNLVIRSVQPGDAGQYICSDYEDFGEKYSVQLVVLDDDPICRSNRELSEVIGQNACNIEPDEVELVCSITYHGNIPPQMEWKKVGEDSSTPLEVSVVTSRNHFVSTLKLRGDIALDSTSYVCETKRTTQGSNKCTSEVIQILYALGANGNSTVNKTIDEEIHCSANTSQSCNYQWKWLQDNDFTIESSTSVLKAKKPGWHRCEAECYLRNKSCNFLAMRTMIYEEAEPSQTRTIIISLSVVVALLVAVAFTCVIFYLLRTRIRIAWNKELRNLAQRCNDPQAESMAMIEQFDRLTMSKKSNQKTPDEFGDRSTAVYIKGESTESEADEEDVCKIDAVQDVSKLHLAAERGDVKTARSLLMSSGNVDVQDAKQNTPLHYATLNGHVDVVDLLLSNNAGLNSRNVLGLTSLHLATKNGHLTTVQTLLNSNADVNAVCSSEDTPLHVAAGRGHADIVLSLISNGANVNACNNAKMTALHLACQNGHTSIVEILLDNHATVDVMKQSDKTPFYLAAKKGLAEVTDLLLSRGVCDFVLTGRNKETPLHAAVENGQTEVVEVILKHSSRMSGKLINCQLKLQENANSLIKPIQLLRDGDRRLSAGIVWSEEKKPLEIWEDAYGRTALTIAAESAQPKMVKLLLNADQGTYSEEHLISGFYRLIKSSINHMVTDSRENNETTANLSDAEKYGMFSKNTKEIAQALISSSKFNVNHQNVFGETPLFDVIKDIGCFPGKKTPMIYIIQLLLERGADFNLKNYKGETPLMIASKNGCCDAIKILFDWEQRTGAKLNIDARDRYGETALMKAVANDAWCHNSEIEFAWMHKLFTKLNTDARDRYGATALIKATEKCHVSVMHLLLDHKASVNLCDYNGLTALHAAVYEQKTNWFDLQFFWKDLRKQTFDDASSSLETRSKKQLQLRGEIMDPYRLIYWLQSHIEFIEETILSRGDVLSNMRRKRGDPHVVFHRLLSNLRIRLEAVKLLLDIDDTNVHAIDFRGNSPLDLAMESAMEISSTSLITPTNCGAIRKFHETPLEVAGVDNRGRNPLHRLIISRFSDCRFEYPTDEHQVDEQFELMIKGILLNPENFRESATATDNKGRTPLHYAAMLPSIHYSHKSSDTIKMLLDIGSEVNTGDIYGKTPLHYAEQDKHYELLTQHGADKNSKDNFGDTPRDLKRLRDSVTINRNNAVRWTNMDLYSTVDIAQVLKTDHVTELTIRKLVETILIYSQSPRPKESSEEAIWKIWTENNFISLNKRLSKLKPSVKHFIERLADGIKKRDWRFECQPILVGSADEETKVVISGDFDFNFKLIKFSQLCDPFPHPLGPKGYFEQRRKTNEAKESRSDERFDSFFNLDHCLLTDVVNSRFKFILEEVLSDPDLWQSEHLFDWNIKHKYSSRYGYLDGLCTNIRQKLLTPIEDGEGGFLFVNISIDIAACVHVEDWWPEDVEDWWPVDIGPTVKTDGCTFVFHRPDIDLCKARGSHFAFSETFARISFAPLESRVIKDSSSLVKAAYVVCKKILYADPGTTFLLKTCLLFCMEAFNARNGNETRFEDKITPRQLAFWVERIMFCYMEFSRRQVFPSYFMPLFREEAKQLGDGHLYLKRTIDETVNKDLIPFSYCKSYDLYLDVCPDDTAIDIPVVPVRDRQRYIQRSPGSIMEQFDREEFIRRISSRSSC